MFSCHIFIQRRQFCHTDSGSNIKQVRCEGSEGGELRGPLSGTEHDEIAKLLDPSATTIKQVKTFTWMNLYGQRQTRGYDLPNPMGARAVVIAWAGSGRYRKE